jgi:hypothetical protein
MSPMSSNPADGTQPDDRHFDWSEAIKFNRQNAHSLRVHVRRC